MPTLIATLEVTNFVRGAENMVSAVATIVSSLTTATNTIQKMESTLISSSGSLSAAKTDLDSIREITDRLGTSFDGAVIPFAKFAASATKFKDEQIFEMFEDVSTALAAIHAPANTASGAFLALQQIVSKGKLSMQDLRRQLAEHIPGAMASAVKAFGDGTSSYAEFEKAVAAGDVVLEDFLPKFTALLKASATDAAARAAQTLSAEMERTSTALTFFLAKITESSGATETWKNVLVQLQTEVLNNEDAVNLLARALSGINTATSTLVDNIADAVPGLITWADTVFTVIEGLWKADNALIQLNSDIFGVADGTVTLSELWSNLKESMADVVGYETAAAKIARLDAERLAGIQALREGAEEYGIVAQKEFEDEISRIDTVRRAQEDANKQQIADVSEVYKETGLMAQEYFDNEVALLKVKAKKWISTGVSIVDAETWLQQSINTLQNKINDSVDKTISKYESLEAQIKATMAWNEAAAAAEAESGVGVNIGGEEQQWIGDQWVGQDDSVATDKSSYLSENRVVTNNYFNQSLSKSDVTSLTSTQSTTSSRL